MKFGITYLIIVFIATTNFCFSQKAIDKFDTLQFKYAGSPLQQAEYLLKKNKRWGIIDSKSAELDTGFAAMIGEKVIIDPNAFRSFLNTQKIAETEIGGPLDAPLSFVIHKRRKIFATYFVIHDVSGPVYKDKFPINIDSADWLYSRPDKWVSQKAHIYVLRTGASKTVVKFSTGWRATKTELLTLGTKSRGLFLHIELVQPRLYPPGNKKNAPVAPAPGFTDLQYQKLAILYMAASIRRGSWLVPAFHACVDEGVTSDGHDDPQNFELTKFTTEVLKLVNNLKPPIQSNNP